MVLDDNKVEVEIRRHFRAHRNINSALSVPLNVEDHCVGVLNVNRIDNPTPFNDDQRRVLQIFAEHVGAILERTQTLEKLSREKEELESSNAELTEMNRTKDVFLSTASHELKTPLTTVIAYAELLKDHEDRLDSEQRRDFITRLRTEAQRLLGLIEDILDLTRLETGKLVLHREETTLSEVAGEAIETVRQLAEKHEITLETDLATDLERCWLDTVKIRQVVMNLLTNAIRYSPPQSTVGIRTAQDGQAIVCEVSDQGPGVREEDIERIFGLFGQGVRRPKDSSGLGIGLHLVKRIVELHDGTVGVRPRVGGGSVFWVRFPLQASEGSEEAA
jgi:signal transduction histidine kinase